MGWPERESPFWPLATLGVICTALCICLQVLYKHGFVMDKDGLTVIITLASAFIMPLINRIINRDK